MSDGLREFMRGLSDASLMVLMGCIIGFAVDSYRAKQRNGPLLRRFADFSVALAIFFSWFSLVYWDRRYNIWPWADLGDVMTAEWYWPFRLMLCIAFVRLWWVIRGYGR